MVSFVGRRTQTDAVVSACRARPCAVVILGAAGVGKSRLRSHTAQLLADLDFRVVTVAGSAGTRSVRLGAFAPLLPPEPTQDEAALVAHLVRDLTQHSPTLVSVDDAHLLDPLSLSVLGQLVRHRVRVVATVTTPGPYPVELEELLRAEHTTPIDLGPLTGEEIHQLTEAHLGAPVDPGDSATVAENVRGNPLLLREVLADAVASGAWQLREGCFRLTGDLGVGPRVARLVRNRVDRLSPELAELSELVAVGERVPLACLDPERTTLLDSLEEQGLVQLDDLAGTWTVRPAHPSIGEALRATLPAARRLRLLDRLCALSQSTAGTVPGLATDAARWFAEAGRPLPAPIAAQAAWQALVALDIDTAEQLARPVAGEHWRAAFVLAETCRWRGDVTGAAQHLGTANDLAPDADSLRRVVMAHSALEAWQRGDIPGAMSLLRTAAERTGDAVTAAFLRCEAAMLATLLGDFEEAVASSRELLASGPSDPLTIWNTSMNLCYAQVMRGDLSDVQPALAAARRVYPAVQAEQPEGAELLGSLEVGAGLLSDDWTPAADFATARIAELRAASMPVGSAAAIATDVLLHAGRHEAVAMAELAVEQLRHADAYGTLPLALATAALVHANAGNSASATTLLAQLDGLLTDVRSTAVLARARAATLADTDRQAAGEAAWQGAQQAFAAQHAALGSFAAVEALAYHPSVEWCRTFVTACTGLDAPTLLTLTAVAEALADGDAHRVEELATRTQRNGSPYLAALTWTAWAGLSNGAAADRAALRARRALDASPWLLRAPFLREGTLTPREAELACLAADGLSNKEIGAKLFVSPRTVGNHLYAVYAKLEVAGRRELEELLALPN